MVFFIEHWLPPWWRSKTGLELTCIIYRALFKPTNSSLIHTHLHTLRLSYKVSPAHEVSHIKTYTHNVPSTRRLQGSRPHHWPSNHWKTILDHGHVCGASAFWRTFHANIRQIIGLALQLIVLRDSPRSLCSTSFPIFGLVRRTAKMTTSRRLHFYIFICVQIKQARCNILLHDFFF